MRGAGKKPAPVAPVVHGWLPRWAAIAAAACGVFYLVGLVLGQTRRDPLGPRLPALFQHFVEAPGLFPHAAEAIIDYRLETWSCADRTWSEVDTRAWFPMRPDDKENRFLRLAQFYHRGSPRVLAAFDDWMCKDDRFGGIRLYSLRLPIPPAGQIERWTRRPLAELPDSVKKLWYQTTVSERDRRCAEAKP